MVIQAIMGLQAHYLMMRRLIDMVILGQQIHKCR
jgi:hypothetical protein